MRLSLDRNVPGPLYRQLEQKLRSLIDSGSLPPGHRLPASRQLAVELGVSRVTVLRVYGELETHGLVVSREGSGTYVAERRFGRPPSGTSPVTHDRLTGEEPAVPDGSAGYFGETIDLIRFTGAGDPHRFPVDDFRRSLKNVLRRDGTNAFHYDLHGAGTRAIRETVCGILTSQGIVTHPDHVVITSGSQQGLAILCQLLLKPGAAILAEEPTYNLALELFGRFGAHVVPVRTDENGLRVDLLHEACGRRAPAFIYVIPNFQNPTGVCLSTERRHRLIRFAEEHRIPIVEDDYAGDLRFEGRTHPAVKALDTGGRVVYLGTFSKMLMPGLRMGYLVADGSILEQCRDLKRVLDLGSSTFMQRVIADFVTVGRYQAHLRRSGRAYVVRRNTMADAVKRSWPGCSVRVPAGGLFMWVELPEGVSATLVSRESRSVGVSLAPGPQFFTNKSAGDRYIRLNFAVQPPERIVEGITRLAPIIAGPARSVSRR